MSLASSYRPSRQSSPYSAKATLRSARCSARQTPPSGASPEATPNFTLYGAPAPRASHRSAKPSKPPTKPTSTPVASPHSEVAVHAASSPRCVPSSVRSPRLDVKPYVERAPTPRLTSTLGNIFLNPTPSIPKLDFSALHVSDDGYDDNDECSHVPESRDETKSVIGDPPKNSLSEVKTIDVEESPGPNKIEGSAVDQTEHLKTIDDLAKKESTRSTSEEHSKSLSSELTSTETSLDESESSTSTSKATVEETDQNTSSSEMTLELEESERGTTFGESTLEESESGMTFGEAALDVSEQATTFDEAILDESVQNITLGDATMYDLENNISFCDITVDKSTQSTLIGLSSMTIAPFSDRSSSASSCVTGSSWSARSCSSLPRDADSPKNQSTPTPFERRRLALEHVESGYYSPDPSEVRLSVAEVLEAADCAHRLAHLLDNALGRELGLGHSDYASRNGSVRRDSTPSENRDAERLINSLVACRAVLTCKVAPPTTLCCDVNIEPPRGPPVPPPPPIGDKHRGHDDTCHCCGPRLLYFSPEDLQKQRARLKKPFVVTPEDPPSSCLDKDLRDVLKRVLLKRRDDVSPPEDVCYSARSQWSVEGH